MNKELNINARPGREYQHGQAQEMYRPLECLCQQSAIAGLCCCSSMACRETWQSLITLQWWGEPLLLMILTRSTTPILPAFDNECLLMGSYVSQHSFDDRVSNKLKAVGMKICMVRDLFECTYQVSGDCLRYALVHVWGEWQHTGYSSISRIKHQKFHQAATKLRSPLYLSCLASWQSHCCVAVKQHFHCSTRWLTSSLAEVSVIQLKHSWKALDTSHRIPQVIGRWSAGPGWELSEKLFTLLCHAIKTRSSTYEGSANLLTSIVFQCPS